MLCKRPNLKYVTKGKENLLFLQYSLQLVIYRQLRYLQNDASIIPHSICIVFRKHACKTSFRTIDYGVINTVCDSFV